MIGIIIFTLTAFIMSILLVVISSKFEVIDEENIYEKLLPGYNCGGCGFNTCLGMAEAMLNDPLNYRKCRPLRGDKLLEMEAYLRSKKVL